MGRIRSIKPEFPQSETMGRLSRDARLLFVQLWTIADDEGRTRAASRMLASLLYPYDDDARDLMGSWLDELERSDCIRQYEVDGSRYLEIVNWLKHQKIDHPSKSRLPPLSDKLAQPREASRSLAPDLGPRTSTKDLGRDQDHSRAVAKATRPKTSEAFEEFWKAYPRRLGANPKAPAFKVFDAAVRQGADPPAIVEGARRCAAADHDKIGTPYIPQAVKWLRDKRWLDYEAAPPDGSVLSDDERKRMFEKLRGGNAAGQGTGADIRGAGVGSREVEGAGRKEQSAGTDDHTEHPGMGRLAAVFREPSGFLPDSDAAGGGGDEQRIYCAGPIAGDV